MKIVCVDDEVNALAAIKKEVEKIEGITEVQGFTSPQAALQYICTHSCDVALLDIQMQGIDGLELAKKIREGSKATSIIFLTGYSEYAVSAFHLHVSGYILKPASKEDIERELQYIKEQPLFQQSRLLRVQCFGNFEVFVNQTPLKFERMKSKELLAYLIDRKGAAVTTGELCAVLWEERPDSLSLRNQLRTLIADLTRTLKQAGMQQVLIKRRNQYAVAVDCVDCDYYHFLRGDTAAVSHYYGEYMAQYSWGEMTLGMLECMKTR